jgi:hypothetical protein
MQPVSKDGATPLGEGSLELPAETTLLQRKLDRRTPLPRLRSSAARHLFAGEQPSSSTFRLDHCLGYSHHGFSGLHGSCRSDRRSSMSAVQKFILNPSNEVGALLDDFIRYRRCRPPKARMLCNRSELPWIFRGYVRPSNANFAWRAWTRENRMCFLVAEIAEAESRLFGAAVLEVRFFDTEGLPFPNDLWEQLPDGTWLQCDRPSDTALRRI